MSITVLVVDDEPIARRAIVRLLADDPTLVLVGEKEPKLMRRSARQLAASMIGATAYMVRGAIHNWPLAAPELFNRTLRAWLADQPLPAELVPVPRK